MAYTYFQWLTLLVTEMYLDELTSGPAVFLKNLNAFLNAERLKGEVPVEFPDFNPDDLRRAAFFMATGSGKTLLMHAHLFQILHYLQNGRHPSALVDRPDARREFDNVLLITPNEGLSAQHIREFTSSGIDSGLLIESSGEPRLFGPCVRVIEIHKLVDDQDGDGVAVPIPELGQFNLVFVDEGHKGTGSEAQTWKNRQKRLSERGVLFEYSATYQQSVASAPRANRAGLMAEYGKCILVDYSYRYFYGDGYGKDFKVLNLARGRDEHAERLLVGGLLLFFQQRFLYQANVKAFKPYNIEEPLWVLLGSSVSKGTVGGVGDRSARAQLERADVAKVVAFFRRFLEDANWAVDTIAHILDGSSGFQDSKTEEDLFQQHLGAIRAQTDDPSILYAQMLQDIFHGSGALELWELKNSDGEIGLRVSAPTSTTQEYFGVINIGDVSSFRRHLQTALSLDMQTDIITPSLFASITRQRSPITVLIGAKKFIEGWSSWRVSSIGLLNVGKSEGPQVLQLFGRGVRLRGMHHGLKRSSAIAQHGPHPVGLDILETLYVFSWNADFIERFQDMLTREEISKEIYIQAISRLPAVDLPVPKTVDGYDWKRETIVLQVERIGVTLDASPRVVALAGKTKAHGAVGGPVLVAFEEHLQDVLDYNMLYVRLLQYKKSRNYDNIFIPRARVKDILATCEIMVSHEDLKRPDVLMDVAERALCAYFDRYIAIVSRRLEAAHMGVSFLKADGQAIQYRLRITSEKLYRSVNALLSRSPGELESTSFGEPLPRLHMERHLYSPLLLDPKSRAIEHLNVSPTGLSKDECDLLLKVMKGWSAKSNLPEFGSRDMFILRNLPFRGVGLFQTSGFFPDFILWILDRRTGHKHVRFLESHGMHHGGLYGANQNKIECFRSLGDLSERSEFRGAGVSVDGYLLTTTKIEEIPGAEHFTWSDLEKDFRLLNQTTISPEMLVETR